MTRQELERVAGGPVTIRLVEPTSYGRLPLWEATMPTWRASIDPVRFRANDDGGDALNTAAAKALIGWQAETVVD